VSDFGIIAKLNVLLLPDSQKMADFARFKFGKCNVVLRAIANNPCDACSGSTPIKTVRWTY
jgi:hypothetical protein